MQSRSVKINDRRLNRSVTAQLIPDLLLVISDYDICTLTSIKWTGKDFKDYLYLVSGVWERLEYWVLLIDPLKNSWNILNVSIISSSMAKTRKIVGSVDERATNRWIGCVLLVNFKTIGMCFIYIGIYFIGIYFKSWYYSLFDLLVGGYSRIRAWSWLIFKYYQ